MLARLWETTIDPAREAEYDAFATAHSAAMFRELPGCMGALFLGRGPVRSVLSLWLDRASIDALGSSERYRGTVDRFLATGILREPQTIRIFEVTGVTLDLAALDRALR